MLRKNNWKIQSIIIINFMILDLSYFCGNENSEQFLPTLLSGYLFLASSFTLL
jgi:hypothetical protein